MPHSFLAKTNIARKRQWNMPEIQKNTRRKKTDQNVSVNLSTYSTHLNLKDTV